MNGNRGMVSLVRRNHCFQAPNPDVTTRPWALEISFSWAPDVELRGENRISAHTPLCDARSYSKNLVAQWVMFPAIICHESSLLPSSLLLIALAGVWAASIPFSFECSKEGGFLPDPNKHKQLGYITDFDAGGATLKRDLQVSLPLKPAYRQFNAFQAVNGRTVTSVIGIVEKFSWPGGVGDPIAIEFYVSKENAMLIKAVTSSALTTTRVDSIAWWICNYDQETKAWYEAAYPSHPTDLKGIIQGGSANPMLNVDMTPVSLEGLNGVANVYKVTLGVLPPPHEAFTLLFANSSAKSMTKNWGLP